MDTQKRGRKRYGSLVVLCSLLALYGCGDDATGSNGDESGATFQGTVTVFDVPASAAGSARLASVAVPGVNVSIGGKDTVTDANGDFIIRNFAISSSLIASFAKDTAIGNFTVVGFVNGATFTMDQVQYSNGQVSTAHTGTWVGTGGSTDPGSQGQIALTMILEANGNALTGTASIGSPDNSVWSISGYETGTTVDGSMAVVSTDSPCASGGTFTGTFTADTLSGSFIEVNPPAGCGAPESGIFRVVKQ